MRSLRTLTVAAGLLGMTPFVALGQSKTTPEALLNFKPSLKGVDYEAVTDPAAINACKVEAVTDANKQQIGFAHHARRPREAAPQVPRYRRQPRPRPVELLSGRLRGLSRERPQQRPEPR